METKYNNDQHLVYLHLTDRVGGNWLEVFEGNTEFYSAAYWDLLTQIWRHGEPVRKTDALSFMTAVKSPHTAGKYVETCLRHGLIVEADNPDDARSKLLTLAPNMRGRLDAFFDRAITEVRLANREVDIKGPSPEEP
jgi:hypothetical protein